MFKILLKCHLTQNLLLEGIDQLDWMQSLFFILIPLLSVSDVKTLGPITTPGGEPLTLQFSLSLATWSRNFPEPKVQMSLKFRVRTREVKFRASTLPHKLYYSSNTLDTWKTPFQVFVFFSFYISCKFHRSEVGRTLIFSNFTTHPHRRRVRVFHARMIAKIFANCREFFPRNEKKLTWNWLQAHIKLLLFHAIFLPFVGKGLRFSHKKAIANWTAFLLFFVQKKNQIISNVRRNV